MSVYAKAQGDCGSETTMGAPASECWQTATSRGTWGLQTVVICAAVSWCQLKAYYTGITNPKVDLSILPDQKIG
jgi:hypothetical protein